MTALNYALLLATLAGLAIPLGAILARYAHIANRQIADQVMHTIVAFGGGALLSAIALVLVPAGVDALSPFIAVSLFFGGGIVFFIVDKMLERSGGGGALMLAMLLDFLPEALALGALLATEAATAKLLAFMIFLQNVPEGFSAFREMFKPEKSNGAKIIMTFFALALLGPLCAGVGLVFLSDAPETLGAIMMFAAGGILYLLFQDIAPESHISGTGFPALGAVAGFALGLAGEMIIG